MTDVAVIFGGPSPEHDVSVLTGLQAARGLADGSAPTGTTGTTVRALFWTKTGDWYEVDPGLEAESFLEGVPRGAKRLQFIAAPGGGFSEPGGRLGRNRELEVEAAVVCCHGGPGEDGTLQAALDLAGICYSGPTVAGAALGMDKLAFGALVAAAGLPTLPRALLTGDREPPPFDGPYIVKPRFGGSSIGIDVVEDFGTAVARLEVNSHLRFGAVVEPYRPDMTDLQVAVRTWPGLELSAVERPLRVSGSVDILGYRDKYVAGEGMAGADRELPARIPSELEKGLRQAAERIAALAEVRGVARIDYLSDGSQFVVNEINTVPGSLARHLWVAPPVPFAVLLGDLLAEARQRPTHGYSAAGADGSVLRSAGSIAGKVGLTHLAVRGIHRLPGEKVLVDIRPHWSFLSGPLFVSMLAIAIGVLLDVAVPHTSVALHWVEGMVVAVPCVWLAIRVVRWRMTRLLLTSERIIEQWGVVSRRQSEWALSDIGAVTVFQSPLRRVLGTGRLEVEGWEDGEIRWIEDVRKPVILQRVINRRLLPHPPGH